MKRKHEGIRTIPVEAVGNAFLLVDERESGEQDWPSVAREVCWGADANRALCDGLLVVAPGEPVSLRMFNPDGSEDFCGNGLICLAAYARETGLAVGNDFSILHGGREIPVHLSPYGLATITLPEPRFDPGSIPVAAPPDAKLPLELRIDGLDIAIRPVSTGTAHAVLVVDRLPEDETFISISPWLETHPLFPDRTTVDWVQPVERGRVQVRIWERGVGETLGCGTGSAAIAATTFGTLHDGDLVVASRGGELRVRWPGSGPIQVTGTAKVSLPAPVRC
jgi:diaminopimelate epimerase